MSAYKFRSEHLRLIARWTARHSIRGGGGITFAFLSLLVGLLIAQAFIGTVEEVSKASGVPTAELVAESGEGAAKVIGWAIGADSEQLNFLVAEKPALVSGFLLVLIFALPFLVSLGAFNQTSGDIKNRGLRYQLLRTERSNIFVGRFLGTVIFTWFVLFLLVAVVFLYLVLKAQFYPAGDVAAWMLRGYIAIAIYALPYVALYAWVSSAIDSPFGSLVLGQLIVGFWPLLVAIGSTMQSAVEYGNYLLPWGYKYWLLSHSIPKMLAGAAIMFAFTGLFLVLGARHFQKRDL